MDINELEKWPSSWAGIDEDIEYGRKMIKVMEPFIKEFLISSYSKKTIKGHMDNLWLLGGYIIKHIHQEKSREKDPCLLLTRFIDSFDGPYISDLSEREQNSFDRTCRKFYKYLVQNVLRKM